MTDAASEQQVVTVAERCASCGAMTGNRVPQGGPHGQCDGCRTIGPQWTRDHNREAQRPDAPVGVASTTQDFDEAENEEEEAVLRCPACGNTDFLMEEVRTEVCSTEAEPGDTVLYFSTGYGDPDYDTTGPYCARCGYYVGAMFEYRWT